MSAAFSSLPSYVSFALAVALANAVAFAVYWLIRMFARRTGIVETSPMVGIWAGATGSFGALLFAFTIITLWNAQARAVAALDGEAVAIHSVVREIVPAELPLVRDYLNASIAEWPELCGGTDFSRSARALQVLSSNATPQRRELEDDVYRQLAMVESLRTQRVRAASSVVPAEIWTALIVIALAMFGSLAFAFMDHPHYHAALTVIFSSVVGMLFWVGGLLDYPFCGGTSISPAPFIDVLHHIGT